MSARRRVITLMGVLLGACAEPAATPEPFTVEVRASAEDGAPLPGASVALGGGKSAETRADGRISQRLRADEGALLRVTATCPADYDLAAAPKSVRLTRTRGIGQSAAQPIPVEVRCARRQADVLVVIRAERGARLPVLVDGAAVTTTDDDGVAHVLLRRRRAAGALSVALDTSTKPSLKPHRPSRTFELSGKDALVLFEQSFVAAPPPAAKSVPVPRRRIPVRVD